VPREPISAGDVFEEPPVNAVEPLSETHPNLATPATTSDSFETAASSQPSMASPLSSNQILQQSPCEEGSNLISAPVTPVGPFIPNSNMPAQATMFTRPTSVGADESRPSFPLPLNGDFVSSARPKPKRMRPSEMNNLSMYQQTIRNPPRAAESSSSKPGNSCTRGSSSNRHSSSSDRWSTPKNIRNLTTGCLDLGELPICVSPELVDRFLEISAQNSANKIETGGLLAGVVDESVRFKVTTLVIPKQNGRSDYWEAIDEANIQSYFSKNELLLLGVIHTHPPPWTAFLSSVDLHQLFDFQKDNPSAVSIVIAPDHMPSDVPAYGNTLTDMGLTVLADCRRTGVHQHRYVSHFNHYLIYIHFISRGRSRAGHELYENATHLSWIPDMPIKVSDLREDALEDGEIYE
jgi:hypothetical protein